MSLFMGKEVAGRIREANSERQAAKAARGSGTMHADAYQKANALDRALKAERAAHAETKASLAESEAECERRGELASSMAKQAQQPESPHLAGQRHFKAGCGYCYSAGYTPKRDGAYAVWQQA